jgi:hypothetical protein
MSFVNKVANSLTSKGSLIIGRGPLTKFTNGINKALFKSKYREFMKPGNLVQLCSKNSHMSLQICASQNDAQRLILMGNGQIGPQFPHAHFYIEKDKNEHLKFRNGAFYLAFDNEIPTILTEPTNPKAKKHEFIRARNEFRMHEILGSDEHFALESVYFPGRFLAILPDGSITTTRDKAEEKAHFFLHVIQVYGQPPVSTASESAYTQELASAGTSTDRNSYAVGGGATASAIPPSTSFSSKQEESDYHAALSNEQAAASRMPSNAEPVESPPQYTNLFPQLPK